jgi:hypothetical protein
MTTRIESGGPRTGVLATTTASRVTPTPDRPFKNVMAAGARAVVRGAEAAVAGLPGGPVLAAAFRPSGSLSAGPAAATAADTSPEGSGGTAGPAGGSAAGDLEGVLDRGADLNMQYLALQERMNEENREFTTYSNVLKARHETIKNAIGNIR